MRHTLGEDCVDDAYHIPIIKDKLVRTLPAVLREIVDELPSAVADYVPTTCDGQCTYLLVVLFIKLNIRSRVDSSTGPFHIAVYRRTREQSSTVWLPVV